MKRKIASWKYPSMLLFGIGISNIGEWIYFIALNLIVLDMTGSPLAVSGLYIIKPLATIFTNFWSGSIIDRLNKRKLMIFLDIFRAMLIILLPVISSIPLIYFIVFILNMASSIFEPASMTYITKLIPSEARKRFNSLHSLVTSGAFLTGPAVAGMLFLIGAPVFAIYLNAIALFFSGIITFLMPNLEKQMIASPSEDKMTIDLLKNDWIEVLNFSRKHSYIMIINFLFSCVMVVMASAIDSLEAAFAKEVLFLSNSEYGFLVTIAGAGIITGAILNALLLKNMRTSLLIGCGAVFVSIGYIIYAFSDSFLAAGIGFFVLSFFNAYANTGFLTFYQNNIPVNMMGRVRSIYSLIEAILIIAATGIMGIAAQMISIQLTVIIGVFVMMILSLILLIFSLHPSKKELYQV
ncbi:MFS transporter [Oceanobacillus chungangensis]|uniref:MFS transporter n=1 Tax=Oceanobacillus chungangensis TaxID=1229152 RepID=A0A3D8PKG7_9BACI|nr:MFS transporter [Oceanobacillus chungangensis]RDW15721.1 MFS transporter [Oceanobacillus chungangensis]